jgi:hypothetical protein
MAGREALTFSRSLKVMTLVSSGRRAAAAAARKTAAAMPLHIAESATRAQKQVVCWTVMAQLT